MVRPSLELEHALHRAGHRVIAGVDEVGRGALAGPVVAAAVVLPLEPRLGQRDGPNVLVGDAMPAYWSSVRDSKAMTRRDRAVLAPRIEGGAAGWAVGSASALEIDVLGIARATARAMWRALSALPRRPDAVIIDGRPLPPLGEWRQLSVVRGDATVLSVASASIVAKVRRDAWMVRLAEALPGYGFESHVGYGAAAHREALLERGPSVQHRLTWRLAPPVRDA